MTSGLKETGLATAPGHRAKTGTSRRNRRLDRLATGIVTLDFLLGSPLKHMVVLLFRHLCF